MLDIGTPAPDFTLKSPDKEPHTLSHLRGSPVLLVFYPFTFTGICEGELCRLRDDFSTFTDAGVQVLAVSCDPSPAQGVWVEQQGFAFPLLSDFWPHGDVARAYDVFNEAVGCAFRSTYLIGADGTIVDAFTTDGLGTAREPERYTEALAKL